MPEMKNSGVEWIGEIPSEWNIIRFKNLIKSSISGEVIDKSYWNDGDELLYTCQKTPMQSTFSKFPKNKRTQKDDLLLTRNATPYVFLPLENAIYSNVVQKVTIKNEWDKRYVKYAVQLGANEQKVNGDTIPSYNMDVWENIYLCKIPFSLQQTIANFLDIKCSEIDDLSTSIQAQIDVLEEYKKSVITETVTKGLNPYNKMKNTDFQYWPQIPESWNIKDVKYIFEIVKRIAGKEGYDILSVTQKGLKIKDISNNEGQIASDYSNYQFVYPTDYVMNHMDLLTGWVDCSTMFGVTSPDYRVFRLRNKEQHNLSYFKYLLQSCYFNRIFYSLGAGVSNLGRWRLQTEAFNNFLFPVPPKNEQDNIAQYLDEKCTEIEAIIEDKKAQLMTLAEYKKSLIYEYVTGKKQVKENA